MYPNGMYAPPAPPPVSPASALLPTPDPQEARHYGRVGKVPWTLAQTLLGAGITIVPWLLLIVLEQVVSASAGGSVKTHRLPVAVDIVGGVIFLLFTAVVEGAFLLAPLIIAIRNRTPGTTRWGALRALGLRGTRFWPAAGWVALGLIVVFAVSIIYSTLITTFHLPLQTNGETLMQEAQTMPFTVIGALIGAAVIAPFCEEIFFRGFLFAGLLRGMNVLWATLLSAFLFTLVHGDIGSALPLFAIGLMLAIIRWRTGSVWPGMALHMLNNSLAAIAVILVIVGAAPK